MTNTLHFSEWRKCIRAQRKVNLCAPGAPKGPKGRMVVRQYDILCANDAGRAPRKYPARLPLTHKFTPFDDRPVAPAVFTSLVGGKPALDNHFLVHCHLMCCLDGNLDQFSFKIIVNKITLFTQSHTVQ